MKLKEGFRLQKTLASNFDSAIQALHKDYFATRQVTHLLKKAGIGEDVTDDKLILLEQAFPYTFNEMLDFALSLEEEKSKLTLVIEECKRTIYTQEGFDIDCAKVENVMTQSLIDRLTQLSGAKVREIIGRDVYCTKDKEGKPAEFNHQTSEITRYDLNKNTIKALIKKLKKSSNEKSLKIDEYLTTKDIDYQGFYDPTDSFEEAFQKFKG